MAVFTYLLPTLARAIEATSYFPANNATGVCIDTPLKITFDAAPTVGTAGAVKIYHSNGTLVETIDLALNAVNGTQARTIGGSSHNAYPVLISGNTRDHRPACGRAGLQHDVLCHR